jgi:hypothetical protein
VQVVWTVILRQLVFFTVQGKLAAGDAVRVAADQRTEVRRVVLIAGHVVISEDDVGHSSAGVRGEERNHNTSIVSDLRTHTVSIGQGIDIYRGTVSKITEGPLFDSCLGTLSYSRCG